MTLKLDSEIEKRLEQFPQILERLPNYLREQIELEDWRQRRYSSETRALVAEAMDQAKSSSLPREEAFARLHGTLEKIASHFDDENQGGS